MYLGIIAPSSPWPCQVLGAMDFADLPKMPQYRSFDLGMYIVTVINLQYHECPVIFKDTDMNLLRQNLCCYVLLSQFV